MRIYGIKSTCGKTWRNSNGELHRKGNPALIEDSGSKFWCINGELHREDGPAIVWSTGRHEYYLNGIVYIEKEYNREIVKRNLAKLKRLLS